MSSFSTVTFNKIIIINTAKQSYLFNRMFFFTTVQSLLALIFRNNAIILYTSMVYQHYNKVTISWTSCSLHFPITHPHPLKKLEFINHTHLSKTSIIPVNLFCCWTQVLQVPRSDFCIIFKVKISKIVYSTQSPLKFVSSKEDLHAYTRFPAR